jgi:hypothetical protein
MATAANTKLPRQRLDKRALSPEQEQAMFAALSQPKPPPYRQLAQEYNVSLSVVQRIAGIIKAQNEPAEIDVDAANAELERLIGQRLPPATLVRALEQLISNPKTPASVRLAAINTAVEQRGIVTRKQRKDAEANRVPAVGIFVLPAGSAPAASLDLPAVVVQPALELPAVTSASPDADKPTS